MRKFGVSVKGRVKNFPLPKNQPLVPVFEVIVNSFNAIEERRKLDSTYKNPQIQIELIRNGQMVLETSGVLPDIVSFQRQRDRV